MDILGSILLSLLGLLAGSLFLYFGAEGLVKGSSSVAIRKGLTPLVVGLTIVSFGTSSPELVVSVSAAIRGNAAIAFGNVVGSNICNIALILGIAALIRPIQVNMRVIKTDIMIMIGVTFVLILMILDDGISRIEGIILFAGIIIYNFVTLYLAKKETSQNQNKNQNQKEETVKSSRSWFDLAIILGGLIILVVGAHLFLNGAIDIARLLGASDVIIGLSIVALGTSLPELATSVVAAIKKEGDISIGNVIGSNIFNILCILGVAAIIRPIELVGANSINFIDIIVMVIVSIILLPLAWSKLEISRLEGGFLLFIYIGYMYYMYTYRLNELESILP
ncbi:calcium/sodium antiporter [Bacteroidota bacterium]